MPDPQPPFKTDYAGESQTTSHPAKAGNRLEVNESGTVQSQTATVETMLLPPLERLLETARYGSGKPRRVIIRGRISRD